MVIQGLFTFHQPLSGMQSTDLYLGRIKFLHVERPLLGKYIYHEVGVTGAWATIKIIVIKTYILYIFFADES